MPVHDGGELENQPHQSSQLPCQAKNDHCRKSIKGEKRFCLYHIKREREKARGIKRSNQVFGKGAREKKKSKHQDAFGRYLSYAH